MCLVDIDVPNDQFRRNPDVLTASAHDPTLLSSLNRDLQFEILESSTLNSLTFVVDKTLAANIAGPPDIDKKVADYQKIIEGIKSYRDMSTVITYISSTGFTLLLIF